MVLRCRVTLALGGLLKRLNGISYICQISYILNKQLAHEPTDYAAEGARPVAAMSPDSTPAQAAGIEVGGSAPVYKAVTIACCGAFLFGYHLGVLNGPLQQLAADLNFADNVALQGLVCIACLQDTSLELVQT